MIQPAQRRGDQCGRANYTGLSFVEAERRDQRLDDKGEYLHIQRIQTLAAETGPKGLTLQWRYLPIPVKHSCLLEFSFALAFLAFLSHMTYT